MCSKRLASILALSLGLGICAHARIGENESELVHRYGRILMRSPAVMAAQGRSYHYGEYVFFNSDDWGIKALLINGRCEEITYKKAGEWTEDQFKHLLELNGGRSQWEEQQPKSRLSPREWLRRDKTTAKWAGGPLEIQSPVVKQTLDAIDKTANEEAAKLPKF